MLAYDWNFLGLSTETKPTAGEKVVDGSTFYECDTSLFYIYYNGEWYQQTFVTEDGINFWLYKALMKKMFGKLFDSNISKGKIIKPTTGTEIEFTTNQIAQITDLTGYGDTFQQTYSGKNLLGLQDTPSTSALGITYSVTNGVLTITGTTTSSGRISIPLLSTFDMANGTSYTLSGEQTGTYGAGYIEVQLRNSSNSSSVFVTRNTLIPVTKNDSAGTVAYFAIYTGSGRTFENYTIEPQLEAGSTATDYEPYVGGAASPNPDYPQDIQTVTGEQTVTINGEQIYTIDLGSIELCKIGDYQDYIYKSGDDWYVHKAIGKYVIDGSENWVFYQGNIFYADNIISMDTPVNSTIRCCSNYYEGVNSSSSVSNFVQLTNNLSFAINTHTRQSLVRIKDTRYTQASDLATWFTTHNTSLYYALATPTDTKITNTTLISNLNSLLNYIFPVGEHQIVITADDLPMALKLTITEKE